MNAYTIDRLCVGMTETFSVPVVPEREQAFRAITALQAVVPEAEAAVYAAQKSSEVVQGEKGAFSTPLPPLLAGTLYSTLAGVYLPGATALLHACEMCFDRPVLMGDVLTVTGRIVDIREATARIRVEAEITNRRGETVSTALLTIGVTG